MLRYNKDFSNGLFQWMLLSIKIIGILRMYEKKKKRKNKKKTNKNKIIIKEEEEDMFKRLHNTRDFQSCVSSNVQSRMRNTKTLMVYLMANSRGSLFVLKGHLHGD
jgi:hypothetical protein